MNNVLHHIAVAVDLSSPSRSRRKTSVGVDGPALLDIFAMIAGTVFEDVSGLRHLSLFSPQMQAWITGPPPSPRTLASLEEGLNRLSMAAGKDSSLRVLGSLGDLPPVWRGLFGSWPRRRQKGPQVNLLVNYGGRREICEAARKIIREAMPGTAIDEEGFSSRLLTAGQPDPDLVILAGGDLEPKDFLLWQSSYAEIWHSSRNGLDFRKGDLRQALEDFTVRQRRFGQI